MSVRHEVALITVKHGTRRDFTHCKSSHRLLDVVTSFTESMSQVSLRISDHQSTRQALFFGRLAFSGWCENCECYVAAEVFRVWPQADLLYLDFRSVFAIRDEGHFGSRVRCDN